MPRSQGIVCAFFGISVAIVGKYMKTYNSIIAKPAGKVNCFSYNCYILHKKVLQNKVFYRE